MKRVLLTFAALAAVTMAAPAMADEALAKSKNCMACHAVDKKLVGPSYKDVAAKFAKDPGAVDMFDDRVYKRGALAVHGVRGVVGDDAFFDLLRRWTRIHRHGLVTSRDFEDLAAATAGRSLERLFDAWLREAALPASTSRF